MTSAAPAIPPHIKDLFERPIVASLATLNPDNQPQVTPVWFMWDGTHIVVNSARGRQKDRNMALGAKVTLCIIDPENPYRWAEARGTVEVVTEEGAQEVINKLSFKYMGREYFATPAGEVRVTYKIAVHKINGSRSE
jgi:PPOX class probable F420-dependent enzyme